MKAALREKFIALNAYIRKEKLKVGIKMVEEENPELTSSCRHTKIITTCRATISENDLKASSKDFPQLKIQRGSHNKTSRRGREAI